MLVTQGKTKTPERVLEMLITQGKTKTPERVLEMLVTQGKTKTPERVLEMLVTQGKTKTPERVLEMLVTQGKTKTPERVLEMLVTMGVCRICYCGVPNKNSLCPSRAKRAERLNGVGSRDPLKGPWWGPGGRTPRSSWIVRVFQTPKRLSSHSFSVIFKTSFSAKSFDILRYKMILMIRAHSLFSGIGSFIGIQRRGSGRLWHWRICGGCAPPP